MSGRPAILSHSCSIEECKSCLLKARLIAMDSLSAEQSALLVCTEPEAEELYLPTHIFVCQSCFQGAVSMGMLEFADEREEEEEEKEEKKDEAEKHTKSEDSGYAGEE